MPAPSPPRAVTVLVVSADGGFRRLAGAAISRAGHEVHTTTAAPLRIDRLIRLRRPDVVVMDVSTHPPQPGTGPVLGDAQLVLVGDGTPGALEKWGPLETLLAEIEHRSSQPARPALRLVVDEA